MAVRKESGAQELQRLKTGIRERNLERLYFFHGEEGFLRSHYLGQIKKQLIDELTESFNFHILNKENFDLRGFADAVESLPMMAENTLVVVDDIDIFKLPEDDRNKLADVFNDIPPYCTVVFTYSAVDWKPDARMKKLWTAINTNGVIVEFAKQDQRELVNWITRHFAANKKQISPQLCIYLIELTGGTMTALAGEISKISAYSGADTITKSDIDAVTEPVLDAIVFQITDLFSEGAYDAALVKLQELMKMQESPILILGAIGNHFRRISTARTLMENGANSSELCRLYRIGDYAAQKTMAVAKRFSPRFCAKAAELILQTDRAMKTSLDDEYRLLEMLLMELAVEARNG